MTQLSRYDPFRDVLSLRQAIDQLFEESVVRPQAAALAPRGGGTLTVDMYETGEAVVVRSAIPGVDPEDIEINITGDTLTIKGETKIEEEVEADNYICRERWSGAFSRSLTIPFAVESDEAEAEFEDGILTLTLPKAEHLKPKAIKIKPK
ncbi:MAG: Hsp20/alpha crystallin family protein [Anaerolineae bacterium]|jgi:HSP20 family protein